MPVETWGENSADDHNGVTDDAYIRAGGSSNSNFGNDDAIIVKFTGTSSSTTRVGLIRFDLSGLTGVTVNAAEVNFTRENNGGGDSVTIYAYECLRDWVEAQATYNVWSTGNSWATAGCRSDGNDLNGTAGSATGALSSFGITSGDSAGDPKTLAGLAAFVESMLGNDLNLVLHSSGDGDLDLDSSEGDDGQRPSLEIDYTAGGTPETVELTAADVGWSGIAVNVNDREAVALSPAQVPVTGIAVNVNDQDVVDIDAAEEIWSGLEMQVNGAETVLVDAADVGWTGLTVAVNDVEIVEIDIAAAPATGLDMTSIENARVLLQIAGVPATGLDVNVNAQEIIDLSIAAALATGLPVAINKTVNLAPAAHLWTGLDLDVSGAEVITLTATGVTWQGLPVTATVGLPPDLLKPILRASMGAILKPVMEADDVEI